MAVKILIKRKFKHGNIQAAARFVINNRTGAMQQPGYISSETLRSIDDEDKVLVVSMWETMEAWEAWKNSEIRQANIAELKDYSSMTPKDFTECIVENYSPPNDQFYKVFGSIGVTDSSLLNDLVMALDELAIILIDDINIYRQDILTALEQTRIYGELWDIDYYIDHIHFLDLLEIEDEEVQTVKNTIRELTETAVIEKKICDDSISCGLNIYLPRVKIDFNYPLRYEEYLPAIYEDTLFAQNTNWDEFIISLLEIDDNTVPDTPTIDGPRRGEINVEHIYTFSSSDIEEDDLYYYIDWGDGNYSGWLGPYESAEEISITHTWTQQNNYNIKAKVRDAINSESEWGTLEVSMPKDHTTSNLGAFAFLVGTVTEIERNTNGDFRFLPLRVLEVVYSPQAGVNISLLDELYGGFPCCGFIDINQFKGVVNDHFICGFWQITI